MVFINYTNEEFYDIVKNYLTITFPKSMLRIDIYSENYAIMGSVKANEYKHNLNKNYTEKYVIDIIMLSIPDGLYLHCEELIYKDNVFTYEGDYFKINTYTEVAKIISNLLIELNRRND